MDLKKGLFPLLLITTFWSLSAKALILPLPDANESVVGEIETIHIEPGDTLYKIARRYGMGQDEIAAANPQINRYRLKPWTKIVIPKAFVLPDVPREGIVVNLPEMRLYYFPEGQDVVMTYPIGVGRQGWKTPVAKTFVMEKKVDPEWNVPESIKEYMEEQGVYLPDIVPPGPDNPLGQYAMRLGLGDVLIHGTNQPSSVGKRSSSGCIRMYPEHVEELFPEVPKGTTVRIINMPYKAGWLDNELYVEAHDPFWDHEHKPWDDSLAKAAKTRDVEVNWSEAGSLVDEHKGIPQFVTETKWYW